MDLHTKIPLKKQSNNLIDYESKLALLGSCFSENIGERLSHFKFRNTVNPLGILFHPKAIETLISRAVSGIAYTQNDVFFHNEQWHCFDAHSRLSSTSKQEALDRLNAGIQLTTKYIGEASHIIITLGTAWVYRFLESQNIVANCHKVPQNQFKKELLSLEEVYQSIKNMVSLIASVNPKAAVVFTVSPVRHLKDGFIQNTQSKSHLISAIHKLLNDETSRAEHQSFYFPSYEIMMDELREYRFYKEDMIHPNITAVNYIWDRFASVWLSGETSEVMKKVDSVQRRLEHKPFNANSKEHLKFLNKLEGDKNELSANYPHITF